MGAIGTWQALSCFVEGAKWRAMLDEGFSKEKQEFLKEEQQQQEEEEEEEEEERTGPAAVGGVHPAVSQPLLQLLSVL